MILTRKELANMQGWEAKDTQATIFWKWQVRMYNLPKDICFRAWCIQEWGFIPPPTPKDKTEVVSYFERLRSVAQPRLNEIFRQHFGKDPR